MSKKHRNRKQSINKQKVDEVKNTIPYFFKSNYFIYLVLFLIISLSLYIRAIIPWEATFSSGVTTFAIDDAVFHMRLVENLIANFPNRLTYDAFTVYPYGSVLSWGSLFDLIIGTLVIIFGIQNINYVGALVPAIMGAFVSIPVYFIGKELFNKKAGLIGALLIAILPGSFLQRSTLGFTDNHVAEVLFSTTFLMFLIILFNKMNNLSIELNWKGFIKNPIGYVFKTPLKYSVMSGIFLGLYLLTWTTGLIFSGLVAIFIIIQIIINHIRNKSNSNLLISTYIIYGISMIMILPFVDTRNSFSAVYYSFTHIFAPISVIVLCTFLVYFSSKIKERKSNLVNSVLLFSILLILFYIIIKIVFPGFFVNTFGSLWILFDSHSGGGITIGEAQPTNIAMINSVYGLNFILSIFGFIILSYYFVKYKTEKTLLVMLWCVFILYALFAQNRFFYYSSVNIAILSGIACGFILDYVGMWKNIKNVKAWNIMCLFLLIMIIGFYPFNSSPYFISSQSVIGGVRGEGFFEWYESLTWMRNNTPDPGLDYYGTYERPNPGEKYSYPDTAYGVMSWWDYGHIITYWGHRIPNANPFQSGIGGGANNPGASPFLIASTEEEANKVLEDLGINGKPGAKYVVSNAYMAYSIQPIFAEWNGTNFGYMYQLKTSQGNQIIPSEKLFNTMESKLHIFDANGLKNYRLVHESAVNQQTTGGSMELPYKNVYNVLVNPNNPISMEATGFVKIFEYVRGAKISGKTIPNSSVEIKLNIITNIGRNITYSQKTISNSEGDYILIVPYSTTGTIPEGTQFDTKSVGGYKLISYGTNQEINDIIVNEISILNGDTILI